MIDSDFGHFQLPIAVGFSECQFDFVVQTLHDSAVELLFRLEPVENQFPMAADALGHGLDRFQTAPHGPAHPGIQESAGPVRGRVLPEQLEALLEQVRNS